MTATPEPRATVVRKWDFESGFDGWRFMQVSPNPTAIMLLDNTHAHSGTTSLQMTGHHDWNEGAAVVDIEPLLHPSTNYDISFWTYQSSGVTTTFPYCVAAGGSMFVASKWGSTTVRDQWVQITLHVTTVDDFSQPTGGVRAYARLEVYTDAGAPSAPRWYDDIEISTVDPVPPPPPPPPPPAPPVPFEPLGLSPTCELWIDGFHVPDTAPDAALGRMTALTGLGVSWGRSTLVDQPDASVCSFTLLDPDVDNPVPNWDYQWDFEDGELGDWQASNMSTIPVTLDVDDTFAHTGTSSMRVRGQAVNTIGVGVEAEITSYLQPGQAYRIVIWSYLESGAANDHHNAYLTSTTAWLDYAQTFGFDKWVSLTLEFTTTDPLDRYWVALSTNVDATRWYDTIQIYRADMPPTPSNWLETVHIGSRVEVYAASDKGLPPTPELFPAGTFDNVPLGPAWPRVGAHSGTNVTAVSPPTDVQFFWSAQAGTFLLLAGVAGVIPRVVAPAPFDLTGTNLAAWNNVPRISAQAGTQYVVRLRYRCLSTVQIFTAYLRGATEPFASAAGWIAENVTPVGGLYGQGSQWIEYQSQPGTFTADWNHWPLVEITTVVINWTNAPDTWATGWASWSEYGGFSIDNLSIQLAAGYEASDRRLVFAGNVTDVTAQPTGVRSLEISANATDLLGLLANQTIGDEPWSLETLQERAQRIVGLAGNPAALIVDTGVTGYDISWRDVDAQTPADLLRDLAQSAGAVLWATGNTATRTFLWIEDQLGSREAARQWANVGGLADIAGNTRAFAPLSACDILRDDVSWSQASADVNTGVDVSWQDQTVDEETGLPAPTDETVSVTDSELQAVFGPQRLSVATELTSLSDAESVAGRFLAMTSQRGWKIEGVTIDTGVLTEAVGNVRTRVTTIMELLDDVTRLGRAVLINEMPTFSPSGDESAMYVDGGSYTFDGGAWTLALNLTPSGVLGRTASWHEFINTTWNWSTVATSVRWVDAWGVLGPNAVRALREAGKYA